MKRMTLAWILVTLTLVFFAVPAARAADDRPASRAVVPAAQPAGGGSAELGSDGGDQAAQARAALEAQWQADLAAAETRSEVRGTLHGVSAGDLRATASRQMNVSAATVGGPYVCLPSCSAVDGRMLSLAGTGLSTFAGDEITLEFAAPASASSLEIGIFDPDTSGAVGPR